MSTVFIDQEYDKVVTSLKSKDMQKTYIHNIDVYMSNNIDAYMGNGPTILPVFSIQDKLNLYNCYGLKEEDLIRHMSETDTNAANWQRRGDIVATDIANALALRYFHQTNNKDLIEKNIIYTLAALYPVIFTKYYQKIGNKVNPEIMAYTINDLSNKYRIKQNGSLFGTMVEMLLTADKLHESKLKVGTDDEIYKYINDVRSRINAFMKNIASVYYKNYTNKNYLRTEKESFDEEHFHEADSNIYAIDRITNNVVTSLVVNGPNMRIVELAANSCKVSVNELRNYTQIMITDSHRADIHDVVEATLYLYLMSSEVNHEPSDVGTNDFYIYCMKIYKKSNTSDKNIIRIKSILDRWLEELDIASRTARLATLNDFRKALFTFFVMSIENMY